MVIPFLVTYSPILPNSTKFINKHWHILDISNKFGNVFKATPITAFRKNTSLRQIIGSNTISHNQKTFKGQAKYDVRRIHPMQYITMGLMSTKNCTTFESLQTKEKLTKVIITVK